MWGRIQKLPKNGSNLRRKLTPLENKTMHAWLPKVDKQLVWAISVVVVHHTFAQELIRHMWGASLADVGQNPKAS